MQDLRLIGVHEDGEHLLLTGADDTRFRMPVDEALRAAVRRDRPRLGQHVEADGGLRPRDVQALIRAGASADEAAERAGWSVDKVHRYEGPILAEREHVAGLAQVARLRARTGAAGGGSAPTLLVRVTERLKERDVEATDASWDSWRGQSGPWTVVLTFAAGGRQRQASWSFDLADRTVSAVDDEARWLSEETRVPEGAIRAPHPGTASVRPSDVYDVEAEGGLRPDTQPQNGDHQDVNHRDADYGDVNQRDVDHRESDTADADRDVQHTEVPLDLMSAMRLRSTARGRRKSGGRPRSAKAATASLHAGAPPAGAPSNGEPPAGDLSGEQVLPLDDLTQDLEAVSRSRVVHPVPEPLPAQGRDEARVEDPGGGQGEHEASAVPDAVPDEHITLVDSSPGVALPTETDPAAEPDPPAQLDASAQGGQPQASAAGRPAKSDRRTGRPSVPAWDEIIFGSRSGADRSSS